MTTLTYRDGSVANFDTGDALELDLDSQHGSEIFSIVVTVGTRVVFSAYHWANNPWSDD
jgi:hypothetical protein